MKKNQKFISRNMQAAMRNLRHRLPLTLKMVILNIIIGVTVWSVVDYIQTSNLENIFHAQMTDRLNNQAMEARQGFNSYVKKFEDSAKLFVSQKQFSDYVNSKRWSVKNTGPIRYHRQPPAWFPKRSTIRTLVLPRYSLLLDSRGKVKEVYNSRKSVPAPPVPAPTDLLIKKSLNQTLMTLIDNVPYLITAKEYFNSSEKLQATLLLASPVDHELLIATLKTFSEEHLVALLTPGEDPLILTSSDLQKLQVGTSINTLHNHYLISEKEFFDYGAAEFQIKFASFISIEKIDSLTRLFLSKARRGHAILDITFILTFALIIYWISSHIQKVTQRITNFSQQTLGIETKEIQKGDQLYILNERFKSLTEEVLASREILMRQANEQTRLIVNNAFDAIVTTDENGNIKTWNPRAETTFGRSSEEAVGRKISETIVSEKHRETFQNTLEHFMKTGKWPVFDKQVEITACDHEGREFTAEFSVSPAWSGNNYIFIFIIRDVTERKQAESKINDLLSTVTKAKTEWEATFDSVTELIMIVDKELNIIRCNKRFAEFTKKPIDEVIGGKCSDFLICGQELDNIEQNEQVRNNPERTEFKTEDGRWLYVTHLPVFDEKGGFLNTVITATDITELKIIEQSLTESRRELKERIDELENFYDMAVNRELKMIELKKEIIRLKEENQRSDSVEI